MIHDDLGAEFAELLQPNNPVRQMFLTARTGDRFCILKSTKQAGDFAGDREAARPAQRVLGKAPDSTPAAAAPAPNAASAS
jgi:hypothetical protein